MSDTPERRDRRLDEAAARQDAERIAAEIKGLDIGTDPFVAAVRATRMPMIVTNPRLPDNPVVFANAAFSRLTGYAREEILGRNCRFLQGPLTDPATVERIRAAVQAGESIETDIRNHRKDGSAFWNRLLLAPVEDADGNLAFFFASQLDVTVERERLSGLETENASLTARLAGQLAQERHREADLRFALEAGRLGSWTLDVATLTLSTSPLCRVNFGRDPAEDMPYEVLRAAIVPDDRERVGAAIARLIETGADYDIDYRIATPDGEWRWVNVRGRPTAMADGRATRLAGVSSDITERKRADRFRHALGELGGLFRDVLDTADLSYAAGRILAETLEVSRAGYGTIDAGSETIFIERDWNAPGVTTLAGTLRFRDFGSYIEDLKAGVTVVIADAEVDPRTAGTAAALKAISAQAFINMPLSEEGGIVALLYCNHATARPWHADELAFVREVGERTRAAVERRRAEQALARLAASLEQQVADRSAELMRAEEALRHSQKMEAIGQLTGGVAHDFNNLLTVIRSSVDLMRRPNLSEERRRRYIDAISDTVGRASRLTAQLLAFARRQALNPEVFDVGDRLRGIGEMLDTVTGSRVQVVTDVPEGACRVRADIDQFETALINMAVNARDAMDGAGTLTLSLRRIDAKPPIRSHAGTAGSFAAITLTDTGPGIPLEQMSSIFEPFFTTKEIGKGTGLGLSQVFGFAKQSGGDVDVASPPGGGATFTLYLPEIEEAAPAPSPVQGAQRAAPGGAGRRVLLVEDNVEVGRFSTQVLQDLGYETVWAASAEEAIATLAVEPPFDVVFSDVVMPGKGGIELAKELRRDRPGLPVVLTSGYSHVLAEEGAHGFELLHKPYSAEQLSRILRRAMIASPRATPG